MNDHHTIDCNHCRCAFYGTSGAKDNTCPHCGMVNCHVPDQDVVFLDVDGVLNRTGKTKAVDLLEPDLIENLRKIIQAVDPLFVISSTWRMNPRRLEYLVRRLQSLGARVGGATPLHKHLTEGGLYVADIRGNEIRDWMVAHGVPRKFVILDDDSDMGPLSPYLIKTYCYDGLEDEHVRRVIEALS